MTAALGPHEVQSPTGAGLAALIAAAERLVDAGIADNLQRRDLMKEHGTATKALTRPQEKQAAAGLDGAQ